MPSSESLELEIVLVNEEFYRAFESLDIRRMEKVWATNESVKCVHPGWGLRSGWPSVRDSWVAIFNHTREISFEVNGVDTAIYNDLACVTCTEQVSVTVNGESQSFQVLATNIYLKREGRWLMIHHHGSPAVGHFPQEQSQA